MFFLGKIVFGEWKTRFPTAFFQTIQQVVLKTLWKLCKLGINGQKNTRGITPAPMCTITEKSTEKEAMKLALTPKDYDRMTKEASPNTKSWRNIPLAFLIGGLICALGQGIMEYCVGQGMDKTQAAAWTSVALVFLSALLTGLKVYDNIAKFGGAGTLVPITGFANAVVSPAIEFKSEGLVLGLGAKMFVIAGPVIVYGTAAAVIYGAVLFLAGAY